MRSGWLSWLFVVACSCAWAGEAAQPPPLLTERNAWRCYFTWQQELMHWSSGEIAAFEWRKDKDRKLQCVKVEQTPPISPPPPAKWMMPDFDDGAWALTPGPVAADSKDRGLAVIYLRTRFDVAEIPAKGQATLSVTYSGGIRCFLNGKEIARDHLPKGDIRPDTLATTYPKEAYVDDAGQLLNRRTRRRQKPPERLKLQARRIEITVPPEGLKKGANVLAIEIHRAPTAQIFYTAKRVRRGYYDWHHVGLRQLALTGNIALKPAVPAGGLRVWAADLLNEMWDHEPCLPGTDTGVVRLAGARNGSFTGLIGMRSLSAVKSLSVTPGALTHKKGRGAIPGESIRIRYGDVPRIPLTGKGGARQPRNQYTHYPKNAVPLFALAETAPQGILSRDKGAAFSAVITIPVPKDAAPGDYEGHVTVKADGIEPVTVPVRLWVADFALPDRDDFVSFTGIMQSPESVALHYGVPLWSEKHWALLDTVFLHLGQVDVKSIFLPLVARTNMGNSESIVRWIKKADGGYTHDFGVLEKYLDVAVKHLKKIPVVCLYVWTPAHGGGSWGKTKALDKNWKPMHFSLLDPQTKKVTAVEGPDWGSAESVPFWRPVLEGVMARLKDRGLERSATLGLVCDSTPSKGTVADMKAIVPALPWMIHSHGHTTRFEGRPTFVAAQVWGTKPPMLSTNRWKKYSWRRPRYDTVFNRSGAGFLTPTFPASCPVGNMHMQMEAVQGAGYDGLSRVGADFWPCIKGKRGKITVISRYSVRNRPGPPTLANGRLLSPGKDGPEATLLFEAMRLGIQESEARIFVEKAVVAKAIPKDLAARAVRCFDDRIRAVWRASGGERGKRGSVATWMDYAGRHYDRTRTLYQLAADVASAMK